MTNKKKPSKTVRTAVVDLLQTEISYIEYDLMRAVGDIKSCVVRAERDQPIWGSTSMFAGKSGRLNVTDFEVEVLASDIGKHLHVLRVLKSIQTRIGNGK